MTPSLRYGRQAPRARQDRRVVAWLDTQWAPKHTPFSWLKWLDTLRTRDFAETTGEQWNRRATDSGNTPPVEFAKALKKRLHGILGHCRWRLHTSVIESINKKIKVSKRMVYGHPG